MKQVIKIGSSCLFDSENKINYDVLKARVEEIKASDDETILVVSGAIALEKWYQKDHRKNDDIDDNELRSLAAQGQSYLTVLYSELFGEHLAQMLLTNADLEKGQEIRDQLEYQMISGKQTFINHNDASNFSEGRLDNDVPSAQIADYISADRLIMLGTNNGFRDLNGTLQRHISAITAEHYAWCKESGENGTGGFRPKLVAAELLMPREIKVYVGHVSDSIADIVIGNVDRTYFGK
jgi:glutamate 5-kinase